MTDKLPPNLLQLFSPRPALRFLPPSDYAPEERRTSRINGVGQFLEALREYDNSAPVTESPLQKRDRARVEKKEKQQKLSADDVQTYKPAEDSQIRGDPFKTLFVSRLSYDTEVKDLEREFGRFGPIERIRIVENSHASDPKNPKKTHTGYAFIVYERERDMKAAYKETDGIRIRDRRVLVDVERGRTVQGWRPRRYGGGLGGRGYTKQVPARPIGSGFGPPAGPGGGGGGGGPGGFRGGFGGGGGGFRGGRGGGFRGGYGDRGGGGGGFRGGYGGGGGGRGGIGYNNVNGFAPEGAPSGPRGGRGGGGFGGGGYDRRGYGGGGGPPDGGPNGGGFDSRGGRGHDDRSHHGGFSGSNREPIRPREGGGYRDWDREGGYGGGGRDDFQRKRPHDNDGYDDPRSKRRY
ncbi:MAG: hypothetical protein M1821_000308 [Bathelium mastoideum]|nr:MAG: hypothetical protein M1821_000308 [Bathelium mastoideum]KAI9681042.1 MAG: hypothetical protein M1822_007116 [Bathelium mastoideum]